MNGDWRCVYIVKKGIIRRVQGDKCLKAPIKMKKNGLLIVSSLDRTRRNVQELRITPKQTENFYSTL